MPHHAKHHASENRKAIERSLVKRTWYGVEPRRGSVMIMKKEIDTITDPLRGSFCEHIAITKLRVLASKDTCMVFRIILASPMPTSAFISSPTPRGNANDCTIFSASWF